MSEPASAIARAAGFTISSIDNYKVFGANNSTEPQTKIEGVSKEAIEHTVQVLEDFIVAHEMSLKFSVHEATGEIVVKVISDADGKVIREIPSEEMLNHAAVMENLQGLLFDETV
jgi:flagellar protein FlaG